MAEIEFKIEAKGIEKVERAIRILDNLGLDTKPLMQKLGEDMRGIVDRNFEAEGRPNRWKPRSPITNMIYGLAAMKRERQTKRYQNAKGAAAKAKILGKAALKARRNLILSLSGDLKKKITVETQVNQVKIGAPESVKYARIHQFGGMAGRGRKVRIVARPYLVVPDSEVGLLQDTALGYVKRTVLRI
ncbi:hypothetical protein SCACP_30210 [Sporomusa carbonis]|uniref:phage virion morphogenesis protein n=1 Tax=Sporomusa carbonis TaxID=3076075 RepID=UPI003A6B3729